VDRNSLVAANVPGCHEVFVMIRNLQEIISCAFIVRELNPDVCNQSNAVQCVYYIARPYRRQAASTT
jgi:hypothetical protein